jgi:transposase InsO family protein
MAMKGTRKPESTSGGEPGTPGEAPDVTGSGTTKRYSPAKRKALLEEFERSGEPMSSFCAREGVSVATFCTWRKRLREHGEQGLQSREPRRNPSGQHGHVRSADARRAAVQAFERSGMTLEVFARTYGCSPWTLRTWLKRYADGGPRALEPRRMGRPPGSGGGIPRVSAQVQAEIVRTKTRFPDFGLKKVRDFLRRFQSVSVSTGTVARTLDRAGVAREPARKKRGKKRPVVRRFQRSRPGELWQSDITSFNLTRHSTKVYLTVFLDDFSRFVVSWNLGTHQRQELVNEALMDGISRFGKPKEVLTDQGRQYFSWRGKSDFQKLLVREGIEHVVSRTHHPETLGKCERLWETINREFWERVRPQDISDARERLAHWFAHYNFFRPHQGIDGLVPADRFFGAQEALRKTHEARLSQRELDEALSDAPRRGVYLFGQIGDDPVSMVGERGSLVVQTSQGLRTRIGLEELGAPSVAQTKQQTETDDADEHDRDGSGDDERRGAAASAANGQEAPEIRPAAAIPARSQGAVDERHGGGPTASAPHVHADPRDVDGQAAARGSGAGTGDSTAACVAAQSAGAGWDAGGSPASTEVTSNESGDADATEGRRSARAEEAHRGARAASGRSSGLDQAALESAEAENERVFGAGVEVTGGELENGIASSSSSP